MAKGTSNKNAASNGPARIRLVILEAEAPDGDLSQITLAVQNALRSQDGGSQSRRTITTIAHKSPAHNDIPNSADGDLSEVVEHAEDETAEGEAAPAAPRSSRTRRPPKTPNVIELDLTSPVSFENFAREKNPPSDQKKFLVVAAWFKLHRQIDAITADHVYTCYRAIKWPSNIPDFGQPLRDLKARQLMLPGEKKGSYAINHLGLSEVDQLGSQGD